VTYAQLKSGKITIEGKSVRVASLASIARSREVAETLKSWLDAGKFLLTEAIAPLPTDRRFLAQDPIGNVGN
jgi:uncharacterized protein (DUF39 family)